MTDAPIPPGQTAHAINAIWDILNHDRAALTAHEISLLQGIGQDCDEQAQFLCARILHQVINTGGGVGRLHWDQLPHLMQACAPTDNPVSRCVAGLYYMHKTDIALRLSGYKSVFDMDISARKSLTARLEGDLAQGRDLFATPVIHTLQAAKVAALTDRDRAQDLFQQAYREDASYMRLSELERGAVTYFSANQITASTKELSGFHDNLKQALAARRGSYAQPKINLVWSVDPRFMRIHGAHWLNMAPFLLEQGYGMIFLVVGDAQEVADVAGAARSVVQNLLHYRGVNTMDDCADNICFVQVPMPRDTANIKTFYACARYIHAGDILEATQTPLMILDIDMTIKDHLDPIVQRALDYDFACPMSVGLPAFYPWRSYMANTVFFNNTAAARAMMQDIGDYIHQGMRVAEKNWTLDQNALDFAICRATEKKTRILSLSSMPRAVGQDAVRVVFEGKLEKPRMKLPANDGYVFNPAQDHGIEDDDCRLCVYDLRKKDFAVLKKIPAQDNFVLPLSELPGHFDLKYKIQVMKDSVWTDAMGYVPLSAPATRR